jgi:hypothetical protein
MGCGAGIATITGYRVAHILPASSARSSRHTFPSWRRCGFRHTHEEIEGLPRILEQRGTSPAFSPPLPAQSADPHRYRSCRVCYDGLPHKRISEAVWERDSDRVKLLVESGLDAKKQPIGVPYGSIARMILLYLQTQAVRTRSREVDSFPNNAPVCKTGFAVRPPRPNTLSAQGFRSGKRFPRPNGPVGSAHTQR